MFDELVKSIRLHMSERLTSPLLGAFVVSWCVWNYKVVVILVSKEPVAASFHLIETLVWPNQTQLLLRTFAGPLATAMAYLFVYPIPARWVFEYTRMQQRKLLDIRRRIEEETPLTVAESRSLRIESSRIRSELEAELRGKDTELSDLKSEIEELRKTVNPRAIVVQPRQAEIQLSDSQERLLNFLGKQYPTAYTERDLANVLGLTALEVSFDLTELTSKSLIEQRGAPGQVRSFTLTHAGRGRVLKHRQVSTEPEDS